MSFEKIESQRKQNFRFYLLQLLGVPLINPRCDHCVTSWGQQAELKEKLRSLNFQHDISEGALACVFCEED